MAEKCPIGVCKELRYLIYGFLIVGFVIGYSIFTVRNGVVTNAEANIQINKKVQSILNQLDHESKVLTELETIKKILCEDTKSDCYGKDGKNGIGNTIPNQNDN